jgi:hypothetical protein
VGDLKNIRLAEVECIGKGKASAPYVNAGSFIR